MLLVGEMRPRETAQGRARLTQTARVERFSKSFSKSFSRRCARKLSAYREGLLENKLPQITLSPALPFCGDKAFFDRYRKDLRLEIGFGAGEHLASQAAHAPQAGFIGCEPYRNGVAALLATLEQGKEEASETTNLRLFADDALLLLPVLPNSCLSFLYLLFPDPWPRRRHGKRRLLRMQVLDAFARLLRAGGILRWSSDEPAFVTTGLAACCAHPCFVWRAERPDDWRLPPADWVATRYQKKAEQAGRAIFHATFERR